MSDQEEQTRSDTRKIKKRGDHKANLIKLKGDIKEILERYRDKREEKFLAGKSCLERKAATIIKLDADISERLGDENEIVQEIEISKELRNKVRRAVLRRDQLIKQIKLEAESEGAMRFGPEKQCELRNTENGARISRKSGQEWEGGHMCVVQLYIQQK